MYWAAATACKDSIEKERRLRNTMLKIREEQAWKK